MASASKRRRIAWTDVAIGAAVSALVMLAFFLQWGDGLELKLYDVREKMQAEKQVGKDVVYIGIDDRSLQEIGSWPWPRSIMAAMVDKLSKANAKVIGLDVLYANPELNPGLVELQKLEKEFSGKKGADEFIFALQDSEHNLDDDQALASSLANAKNVVLPMVFVLSQSMANNTKAVPPEIGQNFLANLKSSGPITAASDFIPPYEPFAKEVKAIGHVNLGDSPDSVRRYYPLVVDYNGKLFPSFALQMLLAYYNLTSSDYSFNPGRDLTLGRAHIPIDDQGRMLIPYYKREQLPRFYFSDVLSGRVPIETFQDINSNNKMDTTWFGIPLEPFGFSRDARPHFSKPRFAEVKFALVPGTNMQTLHLQNSISLIAAK